MQPEPTRLSQLGSTNKRGLLSAVGDLKMKLGPFQDSLDFNPVHETAEKTSGWFRKTKLAKNEN